MRPGLRVIIEATVHEDESGPMFHGDVTTAPSWALKELFRGIQDELQARERLFRLMRERDDARAREGKAPR